MRNRSRVLQRPTALQTALFVLLLLITLAFCAQAQAAALVTYAGGAAAKRADGSYPAKVERAALLAPAKDSALEFTLPGGRQFALTRRNLVRHTSGNLSWIGTIDGAKRAGGEPYEIVVTVSDTAAYGTLATPEGEFWIWTDAAGTRLIDLQAAGLQRAFSLQKDAVMPTPAQIARLHAEAAKARAPREELLAKAIPTPQATVDVMVLYTDNIVTRLGTQANAVARVDHLVQLGNTALANSEVAITLRLVAAVRTSYSGAKSMSTMLSELSGQGATRPAELASVPQLRDQYGADLVALLTNFDSRFHGGTCGLGYVGGAKQTAMSLYSSLAFSVTGDGADAAGGNSFCSAFTLSHEMGHNMGLMHDRATVMQQNNGQIEYGATTYSFGYTIPGSLATVMAYGASGTPEVGRFSNPQVQCASRACGVSETDSSPANNALSLNANRAAIAAWKSTAATQAALLVENGWWWNPTEPGRGFYIELKDGKVFMAGFLYEDSGRATWFVATGPMSGSQFSAQMQRFSGGQTLTGNYQPAGSAGNLGTVTLDFTASNKATMTWPGGVVLLQRFEITADTSFRRLPHQPITPEVGWYWNPNQSGRGFGIELQGDEVFIAGFMYDDSGNPIWYLSNGALSNSTTYTGNWTQYANGQSVTSAFRAASAVGNVGSLNFQLIDSRNIRMTLPNGQTLELTRFESF